MTDDAAQLAADRARSRFNVTRTDTTVGAGKWRLSWSAADLAAFTAEAGDLLHELGYPDLPLVSGHSSPAPAPLATTRIRSAVRAARSRVTRTPPAPAPSRQAELGLAQRAIDDFIAFLSTGRSGAVADLVTDHVEITVSTALGQDTAYGAAGVDLLRSTVESEGAWGRQVRGDVHSGRPLSTVVLSHDHDGTTTARVFVVGASGGRIFSCRYYRMTDTPAAGSTAT
jgi:hypothetical protein